MHLAVFAVGVFISAILIDAMVRTLCCPTFYLLIPFHFYHKTETKNVLQGHSCFLRFGYIQMRRQVRLCLSIVSPINPKNSPL